MARAYCLEPLYQGDRNTYAIPCDERGGSGAARMVRGRVPAAAWDPEAIRIWLILFSYLKDSRIAVFLSLGSLPLKT